jgi:hypothetical protein
MDVERGFTKTNLLYQILSFIIPFTVYIITLSPTISYTDSGELATACAKLAIAHPTGYPLFTMLGKIFYLFHFGENVYILNLMSALFSSIGVLVFFNLILMLLNNIKSSDENGKNNSENNSIKEHVFPIISLSSSLVLAFSQTFWDSSNSLEVWSLHILFINLLIYLIVKASITKNEIYWLLLAYILGLSFTNHLSTIFLSAGFIYLYFVTNRADKDSFLRLIYMIVPFLIGISLYLYLVLKANNNIISWIYPVNLYNFYYHITGRHFGNLMFKSFDSSLSLFKDYTVLLPNEYYYVPLLPALAGLIFIWKFERKMFYFTVLLFCVNVLAAVNYEILDYETYFLLSFVVVVIWIAYGIYYFYLYFKKNEYALIVLCTVLPLLPLAANYKIEDKSKSYTVQDYYYNMVNYVPQKSVIVTEGMDVLTLASFYYQIVKNYRNDVVILNDNLLSSTAWYVEFLKNHYPEFYNKSQNEFEQFRLAVTDYIVNKNDNYDTKYIQNLYKNVYKSIIGNNDVYLSQEFSKRYVKSPVLTSIDTSLYLVPYGLLIKLAKDNKYLDDGSPNFNYQLKNGSVKDTDKKDPFYLLIMNVYNDSYLNRGYYMLQHSKYTEAENLINKALRIFPNDERSKQILLDIMKLKRKEPLIR